MSGTSPDSVSYPFQPYGVLGPYPWQTVNVQDFGATGDGVTDDGQVFQAALDAIPIEGGILVIPPAESGTYLIGQCLRHPSNVVVRGSGASATLKASPDFVPSTDYGGTAMWLNQHSESDETHFTGYRDFNVMFQDVWFDMSGAPDQGAAHSIMNRAVQCVRILNCNFHGGGDATAAVTCDDHLVQGCIATDQRNCTYDHWGGSTNCRVVSCYGRVSDTAPAQLVNFNGARTGGVHVDEVWVSDGFLLANCDLYGNSGQRSISLEPLGSGPASVKNVRIIGNRIYNSRVVMSAQCSGVLIQGNTFSGSSGETSTIWARTQNGLDASHIKVVGNLFRDCNAPAGSGLIDTTAVDTQVIGNTSEGGTFDYGARFRAVTGHYISNSFPGAAVSETLGAFGVGGRVQVVNNELLALLTTSGVPAYLTVSSGNTLSLVGVNASDAPRTLFSCAMGSSTSTFQLFPNVSFGQAARFSTATGLTATGTTRTDAYAITADQNEFTTVAAGTGCILRANVSGADTTIWNAGANTLNVYPVTGNQIDALGINNPDTIAAGASKRYTALTAGFYRSAP